MNFLEKEMQDALEKENAIRKKDGLPPLKSNMTIIYCTEEPHTELKKLDDEVKRKARNKRLKDQAKTFKIAWLFYQLNNKINYRLSKLKNRDSNCISCATQLKEIRKECVQLEKKYRIISNKIESGEIDFNDDLIEKKDVGKHNVMVDRFVRTWNEFVANHNKNKGVKNVYNAS